MKMKRIGGILIGTSALLTTFALTSCGSESIKFKEYKTEATKEEFEKAYNSFTEEKKTDAYDLTVYEYEDSSEKNDDYEATLKNEKTHIETYDATHAILYTCDNVKYNSESPVSSAKEETKTEKIYQADDGLNTIINITTGTYTSLAYNASAAKTRTSSVKFNDYVDYKSFVKEDEAYTAKYYIDESVYTVVFTYDESKDTNKEHEEDGIKITTSNAAYELVLQFYGIDSEYFIGYELKSSYTKTVTSNSVSKETKYESNKAEYVKLFTVKQEIEKFDLSKYKKDYNSYAE